ncbi:MAG: V-type ATP synthase subunit I [Clostridiales bacterium]|jgi:V/A-type H+-transporting ATPase subunit I|nr:V-type ATP synthase subunit I [Clostridiales bacterium]
MAKLKISKIEIITPLSDGQGIVDFIQRTGTVELLKIEKEGLSHVDTSGTLSQFDKYLNAANEANRVLAKYSTKKQSVTDMLSGRTELSEDDYKTRTAETDNILAACYDINSAVKKQADNKAEIARNQTAYDLLKPWLICDIPTNTTKIGGQSVFIGAIPREYDKETLIEDINKYAPKAQEFEVFILYSDKSVTRAVILSHNSCEAEIETALRNLNFTRPANPTRHLPSEKAERLLNEIKRLEKESAEYTEKIKGFANKRDDIKFLIDYLMIRKEKYEAIKDLGMTDNVIVITGYAEQNVALKLKQELENSFFAAISIYEPKEDDDVPVLLKNKAFFSPAENLVGMYSMPAKSDVDPTAFTAFFYYFFFGAMLSDAGYGMLMVIVIALVLKKFNVEPKLRKSLKMFFWCGVSTVIWGTLYGSWFGDIINVVRESFFNLPPTRLYLWVDPLDNLLGVMVWCFGFGLVHLFTGYAIKGYALWKSKDKFGAFSETIPTYVLVLGAAPYFGGLFVDVPDSLKSIAPYFIGVGALLVVLTAGRDSKSIVGKIGGGFYGLYNVLAGYLGDVLSYSRLLALGLSTGVIASVINMLGVMVDNVFARIVMLVFVFIIGHTANFMINIIGSYVHALRLQFVEFYPKFYEGGGRALKPLEINTQFFRFKEDY